MMAAAETVQQRVKNTQTDAPKRGFPSISPRTDAFASLLLSFQFMIWNQICSNE